MSSKPLSPRIKNPGLTRPSHKFRQRHPLQIVGAGPAGMGMVQATGFSARLPLIQQHSAALRVGNPTQNGELRNLVTGLIIPGLYWMGLGINILPDGESRGEQSFNGGIHGFQSYPLGIAPGIIDRLVATMPMEVSN